MVDAHIENYEGLPCKWCGDVIQVYSRSGYCRACFYNRRGLSKTIRNCSKCEREVSQQNQSGFCRKCLAEQRRNPDLTTYKFKTINGITKPEHRWVWEEHNGEMPENWVVHHKNGLKGDNRIENLIALPRGKHHSKLLELDLKERIRALESQLNTSEPLE